MCYSGIPCNSLQKYDLPTPGGPKTQTPQGSVSLSGSGNASFKKAFWLATNFWYYMIKSSLPSFMTEATDSPDASLLPNILVLDCLADVSYL